MKFIELQLLIISLRHSSPDEVTIKAIEELLTISDLWPSSKEALLSLQGSKDSFVDAEASINLKRLKQIQDDLKEKFDFSGCDKFEEHVSYISA